MSIKPIDERVPAYEIMVDNAQADTQISEELNLVGYNSENIASIKTQIIESKSLMFDFKKEYGEQYQASLNFENLKIKAHKYYIRLVKFGRILFTDDLSAYTALSLSGKRKENYGGWVIQTQTFYNNLLANLAYLEKFASLNCSKEFIEAGKQLLNMVIKAKETQEIERGEAQIATVNRDKHIEELDKVMSRLKSVCEVIFDNQPQVLEKLGIVKE